MFLGRSFIIKRERKEVEQKREPQRTTVLISKASEYSYEEEKYVENTFKLLQYSNYFMGTWGFPSP